MTANRFLALYSLAAVTLIGAGLTFGCTERLTMSSGLVVEFPEWRHACRELADARSAGFTVTSRSPWGVTFDVASVECLP